MNYLRELRTNQVVGVLKKILRANPGPRICVSIRSDGVSFEAMCSQAPVT